MSNIRNRSIRVSDADWELWKEAAYRRRVSVNKLIVDAVAFELRGGEVTIKKGEYATLNSEGFVEKAKPFDDAPVAGVVHVAEVAPQQTPPVKVTEKSRKPSVSDVPAPPVKPTKENLEKGVEQLRAVKKAGGECQHKPFKRADGLVTCEKCGVRL